ncbi:hypothetical protein C8039_02880 [Halogeometricum sp. wsp3]|nr:hypothetical protein C8039_02880 [Halogeometricum sp. wsp3]
MSKIPARQSPAHSTNGCRRFDGRRGRSERTEIEMRRIRMRFTQDVVSMVDDVEGQATTAKNRPSPLTPQRTRRRNSQRSRRVSRRSLSEPSHGCITRFL